MKHQAADAPCRLPTTGMDKSPLEDDVLVLAITQAPPEGEKTEKNAKHWNSLSRFDAVGIVKPTLPEVLQQSVGTDKEKPRMTCKLVTDLANDPHCRQSTHTTIKESTDKWCPTEGQTRFITFGHTVFGALFCSR